MEENKEKKGISPVVLIAACLLVFLMVFATVTKFMNKDEEEDNKDEQKTTEDYKVLSTLNNQGRLDSVVNYKGEVYYISETTEGLCKAKLVAGEVTEDKFDCTSAEDETKSGSLNKLNVQAANLKVAYAKQSFRTDGATVVFIVFNDGKVNKYEFVDNGNVEEDIFSGEEVSKIDNYECSESGEEGCTKEKYTVTLNDGTSREIEK